ncbi:MAG TPA: hypothetical protein VGD89_14460 [Flavipsychrobacter sp.]
MHIIDQTVIEAKECADNIAIPNSYDIAVNGYQTILNTESN